MLRGVPVFYSFFKSVLPLVLVCVAISPGSTFLLLIVALCLAHAGLKIEIHLHNDFHKSSINLVTVLVLDSLSMCCVSACV